MSVQSRPGCTFQAMAEHCRIQKTYLSKVLNRDGHLSEDQLFLAMSFLEFNDEEREFTYLLHAHERSQLVLRRKELESRINAIRGAKLRTEANLDVTATTAPAAELTEYFLDPHYQVIHMLLTLKRFRHNPKSVADGLQLPPATLQKYFDGLERMKLVRFNDSGKAQILQDNLHLPEGSPLQAAYAARMRLKAMERMDRLNSDESYRFSVIFSSNSRVRQKIHASFMDWLKSVQKQVRGSSEDEVYQINFDLLNWS